MASRLIDPLLKFRLYDEQRQALIKQELEQLKAMDNLARDLFEKSAKRWKHKPNSTGKLGGTLCHLIFQ